MPTYSIQLETAEFSSRTFPANLGNYRLSAAAGNFASTYFEATLKKGFNFTLETGLFQSLDTYAFLNVRSQAPSNVDTVAAGAPYPPPDFFTPTLPYPEPATVLNSDGMFGINGITPSTIYVDYYDSTAGVWNDEAYETQYPGQMIPQDLKQAVSDQNYSYGVYLVAEAAYKALYASELVLQWPYFFAKGTMARG